MDFDASTPTYAHDANGNLTSDGVFGYAYDTANQLTNVVRTADGARVLSARYDALGRRVEATRADGSVERYVYFPGSFLVLAVLDGANAVKEVYTRGPDLSGTLDGAGGIGGILACTYASGATYCSHADIMGNVIALTDASGSVAATFRYTPFGQLSARTGSLLPRYLFSSKEFDRTANLYYYGYRYYAPQLGRWLTRDLVAEYGGVNLYVFCDGNPIDFTDPYALKSLLPDGDFPIEGILEVAWAVLLNNPEITLTEDVLGLIRSDPDMLRYDREIEEAVMAAVFQYSRPDTITVQCKNFHILKQGRVTFGGTRAPENMWEQLQGFWRPEYRATWRVAANPLTWLLRHANIMANTEVILCFNCVEYAGTYSTEYELHDTLDLRPHRHGNHEFELLLNPQKDPYDAATILLGTIWHDLFGRRDDMQVKAEWKNGPTYFQGDW